MFNFFKKKKHNKKIDHTGYTFRPYCPEDEQDALSLWKAAFNKEISPEVWRWKYINGPFKHRILLCVNSQNKIVVFYGGIPFSASLKGKRVTIIQLMDIMSHPDYRGSFLFRKTCKLFFDRFTTSDSVIMVYGLPGLYHYKLGERFLGYRRFDKDIAYLSIKTDVEKGILKLSGGVVKKIEKIDSCFDQLWTTCCKDYNFAVIRNSAFLHWRFEDHPVKHYKIWGWYSSLESDLNGYAVFSMRDNKATMVDILMPPSVEMICGFIKQISSLFYKQGIAKIDTWLPEEHFISKALGVAGFKIKKEPLGIVSAVKLFEHSSDISWISSNFYYSMADSDLF